MTEGDGELNEDGGLARSGRRTAKGVRGSKTPKTKEGTSATRKMSGED